MITRGWLTVVLGAWLVIAAFLAFGMHGQETDDLIVGLVVATIGFTMFRQRPMVGWVVALLGMWVCVSAFIPTMVEGSGLYWNNVVMGAIIAAAGLFSVRPRKEVS